MTKKEKELFVDLLVKEMKIMQILNKYPNGLKAREIAELINGVEKKEVNSIL